MPDWEPPYLTFIARESSPIEPSWRRIFFASRAAYARAVQGRPARGRGGLCAIGRHAVVASHFPHFGEEDCLRGRRGSGTIFFSGCNLRCVFCQNYDISWQVQGERASRRSGSPR